MTDLSHEILLAHLNYDPATGHFVRLRKTSNNMNVGDRAGSFDGLYEKIGLLGRRYYSHRLAWFYTGKCWPPAEIDHINGDKTDNRLDNLRLATRSQNVANRKVLKTNKTGIKGVCWDSRRCKWIAQCMVDGRNEFLGAFDTSSDAHSAYSHRAKQVHGNFVRT